MLKALIAVTTLLASADAVDVGPLVRALWIVQRHGTNEAMNPAIDQRLKGALAKANAKDGLTSFSEIGDFMGPQAFYALAGSNAKLEPDEINKALEAAVPESRTKLLRT